MRKDSVLQSIRRAGFVAASRGFPADHNTFEPGTVPYSCWLAGWEEYHQGNNSCPQIPQSFLRLDVFGVNCLTAASN